MKYVDFKKFTDENGAQPIYLFEGEEIYFREKGELLLKSRFVQDETGFYHFSSSFITSLAMFNPATEGTNEMLPGECLPGAGSAASNLGVSGGSVE